MGTREKIVPRVAVVSGIVLSLALLVAPEAACAGLLVKKADPAAEAARSNFKRCDGYEAPSGKGDGITTGTWLFGLGKMEEDIRPGAINAIAQDGIDACDTALADPVLLPEFTIRRAHLMQAKAFHQISSFAYDDALASLDAIDAMRSRFDPVLFDRGIGLGNRLLRAWIFAEQGHKAETLSVLDAIERERRYSASVRRTVESLRYKLDTDLGRQLERMKVLSPTVPSMAIMGFLYALDDARMDDAVALGAAVSFERPEMKGRWQMEGAGAEEYRQIAVEASYAGAYAYALAATGEAGKSAATLARARAQLADAMAEPSPPADGKPLSKAVQTDFAARTLYGKQGLAELDNWEWNIATRKAASELGLMQLSQRLQNRPRGSVPVVVDLIQQAGQATGLEKSGVLAEIRANQAKERDERFRLDLLKLIEVLPRPETPTGQVKLKKAGDGYFLSDNGYSLRQAKGDPSDWTVRFTHALASSPTLEEHAVLAAAQATLDKGYDAFLIQSERVFERTTHISGVWVGSYDENSGREAQLRVRMVHSGSLPADLAGAEWRLLSARDVVAQLTDLPHR